MDLPEFIDKTFIFASYIPNIINGDDKIRAPSNLMDVYTMRLSNIIISLVITVLTISLWALANRPEMEPPWPDTIQGFSFSPLHAEHDPAQDRYPTEEEINSDLALLSGKTHAVRTYSVHSTLAAVPKLARKYDLNVALGGWLDRDQEKNSLEIEALIHIADKNRRNVVRVLVGNEVLLREDLSVQQLIAHLKHVRAEVGMPVSTAEPWHIWVKYPELIKNVDYIAVHMLPFWEGISLDNAVGHIENRMEHLKKLYPEKPIVITEVGWPSHGRTQKEAVASEANEATFLRRFLHNAEKNNYIYYLMEAFDQPWKREIEGSIGAYWGVYDVERQPKFEFTKPIIEIPQWDFLAGLSVLFAIIFFMMLSIDAKTLNNSGRSFLAFIAFILATVIVWIIYDYVDQYMTLSTVLVGIVLVFGMVGVAIVLLIEAHEWAETLWVKERRRELTSLGIDEQERPFVSIHVPAYNEPPDMMIETLNALSKLDYENFEVIVIDNNTKDPLIWQPVEAHCKQLGDRFKFYHKAPLSGFKSGALNFALEQTTKQASVIAVIDSDYCVTPNWLKDLVPQFSRSEVAIVQSPQDYRDLQENAFKAMCFSEYRGFFYIGMVTRNERNAIIQHGTMTMVRKTVLEEVGGWSENTITEDAELGLMIFSAGHEAVYSPKSYGKGLMPDTFVDYKNQRFRWAYGAMQIMRHHWEKLSGQSKSQLSSGQRYHFIAGWLPWLADGINLVFNLTALLWTLAMVVAPEKIAPPLVIFSILPLTLFVFKILKLFYLYRGVNIVVTLRQTIAAAISGLALSHTIAKAMWLGLFTTGRPFLRTPKMEKSVALFQAIGAALEETFIMALLWIAAVTIYFVFALNDLDLLLWFIVLLVQSLPYVAAVLMSVISAFPGLSSDLILSDKQNVYSSSDKIAGL
ncbi:MAG: glycosyltransferase [Gammaproteobacteria bacterium]|nr:glycosyltransferase [Gammaproteobacteria bacterium]